MRKPRSLFSVLHSSARSGQSLIEVMVAITVLTVGFLGITTLLSRSLALNRVTTNEITATYLASEGVEVAKNLIDYDVHAQEIGGVGDGWGTCFSGRGTTDFEFDYTITSCNDLVSYDPSQPLLLWYHPDTHLYNYIQNGGTATSFSRLVRVVYTNDANGKQATVNAIVTWSGLAGTSQSVNLEDHFYDWY